MGIYWVYDLDGYFIFRTYDFDFAADVAYSNYGWVEDSEGYIVYDAYPWIY